MKSGSLQIVNTLRQMLAGKAIHAFQFHDDLTFHYDVSKVLADAFSFVANRKTDLGFRVKPPAEPARESERVHKLFRGIQHLTTWKFQTPSR